jgi:hypothetical protein
MDDGESVDGRGPAQLLQLMFVHVARRCIACNARLQPLRARTKQGRRYRALMFPCVLAFFRYGYISRTRTTPHASY